VGTFFYQLFLVSYALGIRLAALFNHKARLWVMGRKKFPSIQQLPTNTQPTVWMHCASLGEFEQGRPLLEKIRGNYPTAKIVLSFFSPSGYEVMKNYPGADYIFYLPMDSPSNAERLIDTLNPTMVLWVKYEFWYYYLAALKKRKIPLLLVSGIFRDNQPFFTWYGHLWKKMLTCFTHIFIQNNESEKLLAAIGYKENLTVSGDTRFDRVIEIAEKFSPVSFIEKFCGNSKVIVAGSTWDDDEAEWTHYVKTNPQIKFIIAPHEIDEGNLKDVQKQFPGAVLYSELRSSTDDGLTTDDRLPTTDDRLPTTDCGLPTNMLQHQGNQKQETNNDKQETRNKKRSTTNKKQETRNEKRETRNEKRETRIEKQETNHVLIIDNIGMLSRLYQYATITYVGGGFNAGGIHNVLEAAVYGKPVIFGPVYEKFAEAVELIDCGAGISIENALELEKVLTQLWHNEALLKEKCNAAKAYVYSKTGAADTIMQYIQEKRLLTN
jgi:3-deoxy-D-manno-octulosonic-acid transferase